jgi:hypothetical protein
VLSVKLGDSEETLLIQCTADEKRARVLGSTFRYTEVVTNLSRGVKNFSSIAQSSTAFLNKQQKCWISIITGCD